MAAPTIGRRRRWAPQGFAQIDRSHPLAVELASFMVPTEGTRRIFDYAAQTVRVQPAAYRVNVAGTGPFGRASHGDLDRQDLLPAFNSALAAKAAVSTFTVFCGISGGTKLAQNAYVRVGSAGAANATHWVYNNTGADSLAVSNWGNDITVGAFSAGWHSFGTTYGATANEGYIDGLRGASGTAAAYTGDNQIRDGFTEYAYYALIAVWFRRLTAMEFAQLHADPFCVLRY